MRMISGMKRGPKTDPKLGPLKATNLFLDDVTLRMLDVLGRGNKSLGVRAAARVAFHRYQTTLGDARDLSPEES